MKKSSGIVFIKNKKILLVHPTNSPWRSHHSIPKGLIEKNEDMVKTAIREVKEEIGIKVKLNKKQHDGVVIYRNSDNDIYKKVFYYIMDVTKADIPDIIPKNELQLREVDDARFYTYNEAKEVIFWRWSPLLEELKSKGTIA